MKKNTLPASAIARCPAVLKKFPKLRLMVAGDLVADEAVYGDTERISREAPVLILRYSHTHFMPGERPMPPTTRRTWGPRYSP